MLPLYEMMMRAQNGGTLYFEDGRIVNHGGLVEALDGSVVEIGSTAMEGGTFSTDFNRVGFWGWCA